MHYIPEVAPLLDTGRYANRLAFILPVLLERVRLAGAVTHRLSVDVHLDGAAEIVRVVHDIPNARGNATYVVDLNPLLARAGVARGSSGYVVVAPAAERAAPALPNILKAVGHWVSYENARVYAVIPSAVQYASSRLNYGPDPMVRLLDYFGLVRSGPRMRSVACIINPFPGVAEARLTVTSVHGQAGGTAVSLPPFSTRWVPLDIPPVDGSDTVGSLRISTDHRLVSYVFFQDTESGDYFSADHSIPWVNRFLT